MSEVVSAILAVVCMILSAVSIFKNKIELAIYFVCLAIYVKV